MQLNASFVLVCLLVCLKTPSSKNNKSLLQFTKSFPISREEWPHWQQCSTDLTISSPPPPMCKCFVIKEQLHSAFTVLDGGCCPSISFFYVAPHPNPPASPAFFLFSSGCRDCLLVVVASVSGIVCERERESEGASAREEGLSVRERDEMPACASWTKL